MSAVVEARCCCGALGIQLSGEAVFNGVCHCANCRRRTGSAFGWQCYFREEAVSPPHGEVSIYAFASRSGPQERGFCTVCGTTLYWRSAAFPGVVGVAAGCLPEGAVGPPTVSAAHEKGCVWLALAEDVLAMPAAAPG